MDLKLSIDMDEEKKAGRYSRIYMQLKDLLAKTDDEVSSVMSMMIQADIKHMPVIEENKIVGMLTLADLIGLDTCLAIMETIYNGFNDSKYRPCPLLRKYVEAGWLGRKSGKGFYEYGT